jgi:hypothetical protein
MNVCLCLSSLRSRLRACRASRRPCLSSPFGSAGALEIAARARSDPQGQSKWPLELARSRRMLEMAARAYPRAARAFDMAARACPGDAGCSKWLLQLAPKPQGRSKRPFERALEPQGCQGCSRLGHEGLSQLTFEMAARRMPSSGRLLSAATSAWLHFSFMHGYARVRTSILIYAISILKFAFVASALKSFVATWRLENTAIYHTTAAGGSKWQLEPTRSRSGARNGRSSPPRSHRGARNRCSSSPRSRCGARNGRSSPVGVAGALEMAARAPSASLGRTSPLGFAGAVEIAAQARSASLKRSHLQLESARPRWGVRNDRSSLCGFAGAVEIAVQACSVGLAGELDSAAQASCEKAIRKRCARVATRSGLLALFVYPPSMDMLGSALVSAGPSLEGPPGCEAFPPSCIQCFKANDPKPKFPSERSQAEVSKRKIPS